MTDDPQGMAHSLEMTATLLSSSLSINPNTLNPSWALRFSYPDAFDPYLKQISAGAADIYINDQLVAQSAKVGGLSMKPETDKDPALYVVVFKMDGGDAVRFHIGQLAAAPTCAVRLVSTQLAMFAPSDR